MLAYIAAIVLAAGAVIKATHWLLLGRLKNLDHARRLPRQIILLLISMVITVAAILLLPISESARNQLIGLLGIFISGLVAFSTSTTVANFTAGLLLRTTKPFSIGDFIRAGDYFGRVSDQGLFDTEIQSESRELIAIPNTYLIRNPVATVHSSGAIVSTTLSLGYETDHSKIETLLCEAAEESGLKDPFVHILELGNFAVTYRISGLLPEVKWIITANSKLNAAILDTLHREGMEIMSPSYMNQRRLKEDWKAVPPNITADAHVGVETAEEIVFDKAEEAERLETEKQKQQQSLVDLEEQLKNALPKDKKIIKQRIQQIHTQLKQQQETEDSEKQP